MKLTILVSSCGRRVQLMESLRADARALGVDLTLLGSDVDIGTSAAAQKADAAFSEPRVNTPQFLPALLKLCRAQGVNLVIPTIDPSIPIFAKAREEFRQEGIDLVVSAPAVAEIANNKLKTFAWLDQAGIPTPRTFTLDEARSESTRCRYPLIAKPVSGSGSAGIRQILHAVELYDPLFDQGYLVQEWIAGTEYTVNMYFDLQAGRLRCVIPHKRIEVRSGEVAKGMTLRHAKLEAVANDIGAKLSGARGCICFQAIEDAAGRIFVIEINARFGGGFPLAHRAGARFTAWLMEETLGLAPSINNDWKSDILMTRYDDAVYVG